MQDRAVTTVRVKRPRKKTYRQKANLNLWQENIYNDNFVPSYQKAITSHLPTEIFEEYLTESFGGKMQSLFTVNCSVLYQLEIRHTQIIYLFTMNQMKERKRKWKTKLNDVGSELVIVDSSSINFSLYVSISIEFVCKLGLNLKSVRKKFSSPYD